MTIRRFKAERFRCLASADVELASDYNVIFGDNASGKTSFLEALAYLGRGKSFRGAPTQAVVQHGCKEFVLFGRVEKEGREFGVGVENGPEGLAARVDNQSGGASELAAALPLQIIDPDVHNLVAGGPEQRRRFIDWIAFHVEHGYVDLWRQFRRALKQRNAGLRSPAMRHSLEAWDAEYIRLSMAVDAARRRMLEGAAAVLTRQSEKLLEGEISFEYSQGWAGGVGLEAALAASRDRDVQQGSTQVGPHRADLKLRYDERQAKRLVSRGQQKLLACSMVLAAAEVAQDALGQRVLLLLDDPAAELDRAALGRLLAQSFELGGQLVATSLEENTLTFPKRPRRFHVKQGVITAVN
ncbi:MAG: DNA replication/repair protein RecF [Woeseiaceae bacterium]|nr:DNA replication/repair protein RecF [Woeseiaceae bacterium]